MFRTRCLIWGLTLAAGVALPWGGARAAQPSDKPQGAEVAFVTRVQSTISGLYPTPAAAEEAGYFRYNNEDCTGAISYVNPAYWTSSISRPSQLWYDVHGNLLGVDYTTPKTATPPNLWGVAPARWSDFEAHVHWVLKLPGGGYKYGLATSDKKYKAAGGDVGNPTAQPLVTMGKAPSVASVVHVFAFPDLWDMELWVKANPRGAFAAANPLVHPVKTCSHMDESM